MYGETQTKIDSLLRYRGGLDDAGRELFDMLIGCANEVARVVERDSGVSIFS